MIYPTPEEREPRTDTPEEDELSYEERAELERLWAAHKKRLAEDGGVWPEYQGD